MSIAFGTVLAGELFICELILHLFAYIVAYRRVIVSFF